MSAPPFSPGCFGKLPFAADFVAHNAGSHEALGFEQWLREAVALANGRLKERWAALFRAAPEHRFAYWHAAPKTLLVGTMSPSADRSGRLFPFSIFLAGPAAALPSSLGRLPAAFAGFFDAASRIVGGTPPSSGPALDLAGLAERVDALAGGSAVPGAASGAGAAAGAGAGVRDLVGSQSVGDLAASLGAGADPAVVSRVAAHLAVLAARFAQGGGSAASGLTLRFPLPAAETDALPALAFWLDLVERSAGRGPGIPVLFWSGPGDGARGHLDVSFRSPAPSGFLHLIDPSLRSDALFPLDEDEPPPRSLTGPWAAAVASLGDASLTLADALEAIPRPA